MELEAKEWENKLVNTLHWVLLKCASNHSSSSSSSVWPDWAIYCTFQSLWQQLFCPNHPYFRQFCKGVNIFHFLVVSFLGNFYRHLASFYLVTLQSSSSSSSWWWWRGRLNLLPNITSIELPCFLPPMLTILLLDNRWQWDQIWWNFATLAIL